MKMSLGILNLVILGMASLSQASEIDSFTRKYEALPDSSLAIDSLANKHLDKALKQANSEGSCSMKSHGSKRKLTKILREHFNIILFKGQYMQNVMTSKEVVRRMIPRKDSIYQYHTKTDGYLLVRPAADRDGIGMGEMMQYKNLYIGTDKIEHLFGRGYIYYYEHYFNKKSIESVLETSAREEKQLLGGMWFETGIFSYADLVANFNGIRFWNDFLKENADLLGRELEPVVKCQNGKWVVNRAITFEHYLDDGVDETLNCIQTATENGARGILRSIRELQEKDPQNQYACPMGVERIEGLKAKYGVYAPWLFNFEGIKPFEYNFPTVPQIEYPN